MELQGGYGADRIIGTFRVSFNNFSAKNNLGNSYKAIGRYDLAESNYSSALKLKPDDFVAWLN